MKKLVAFFMSICLVLGLSGCSKESKKDADKEEEKILKVAVITESKEDDFKEYEAAKNMVKEYSKKNEDEEKDTKDGKTEKKADKDENEVVEGSVVHLVLPKNLEQNMDKANKEIITLVKDKSISAIVLATDKPGFLETLKTVREKRPDMITICASTSEEPSKISEFVDLCIDVNMEKIGENIVSLSKELGAKTFVYYSSKADLADKKINFRRSKIKETCKNEGIQFVEVITPDYSTEKGKLDMEKYLEEDIPKMVEKYGKDINIFGASDLMDEVIIKKAIELKYIVAQQNNPSPTNVYPRAMGLKLSKKDKNDFNKINDMISEKAKEKGISNRLGGAPMPTKTFLVEFSVHLATKMLDEDLTQEDVSDPDYLEKFAEEKYGIGVSFEKATDDIDNYQLMLLDQIIY